MWKVAHSIETPADVAMNQAMTNTCGRADFDLLHLIEEAHFNLPVQTLNKQQTDGNYEDDGKDNPPYRHSSYQMIDYRIHLK